MSQSNPTDCSPPDPQPPKEDNPLQQLRDAANDLLKSHDDFQKVFVVNTIGIVAVALTSLAVVFRKMAAAADPTARPSN